MNTVHFCIANALLAAAAQAQSIAVVHSAGDRVARHDAVTGAELEEAFLDLDAITGDRARTPYAIARVGNELWVTDSISDTVFRLSGDGSTFVGEVAGPLDRVRGLTPAANGGAWVCNGGDANGAPADSLVRIAQDGTTVEIIGVPSPVDVIPFHFAGAAGLLVSDDSNHTLWFVDPTAGTRQPFHVSDGVTGIDQPRQLDVTADGTVLAAGWGNRPGVYAYDPAGVQTWYLDTSALAGVGGILGVRELATGDWLLSSGLGTHLFDRSEGLVTMVSSGSCRFVSRIDLPTCQCTSFCTPVPNSSGSPGRLRAVGSTMITDASLALVATSLPPNTTVMFLGSTTQGLAQNPAGSVGNLCLRGSVGRFARPGEVQEADVIGVASLSLDLSNFPGPDGAVGVAAGESWSFQAWFRDSLGGASTSNFTDGAAANFE